MMMVITTIMDDRAVNKNLGSFLPFTIVFSPCGIGHSSSSCLWCLHQKSSTLVKASSKSAERSPSLDIYHSVISSLLLLLLSVCLSASLLTLIGEMNNFNSSMYFRLLAFIPCAFVASTLHHIDRRSRMYNWSCLLHPECLWYISIHSHMRHMPYLNKRTKAKKWCDSGLC